MTKKRKYKGSGKETVLINDAFYMCTAYLMMPCYQGSLIMSSSTKRCYRITRKNTQDVLILTAIARSRFDSDGSCTFDGKIGCFPLVTYEVAKRSNANRPAGMIEMKPITFIVDNF